MLSDHEHDISVLSNLGLIERCNKPNTNTNIHQYSLSLKIHQLQVFSEDFLPPSLKNYLKDHRRVLYWKLKILNFACYIDI